MAKRKADKVSDQIRAAIEGCGMTRYRISKLSGIDQATLTRFMQGTGGLSNQTLDAVGEAIGLQVSIPKQPRK